MSGERQIPLPLRTLFDAVCDETATAAEVQELETILRGDSESMLMYLDYCRLHVDLQFMVRGQRLQQQIRESLSPAVGSDGTGLPARPVSGDDGLGSPSHDKSAPSPQSPVLGFLGGVVDYVSHSRMLMFWLMFSALATFFTAHFGVLLLGRFWAENAQVAHNQGAIGGPANGAAKHRDAPGMETGPRKIVARLTDAIDCQWTMSEAEKSSSLRGGEGASELAIGTEFAAGQELNLAVGLAEITFDSGAKVILHAPARFTVGQSLDGNLQFGKITAKVPHSASGFTIDTPGGKVVDLGTEFGVKVNFDRTMHVIVYVGEVAVSSGAGSSGGGTVGDATKPVHVKAGEAIVVTPGQPIKSTPAQDERFVRDLAPLGDKTKAEAAYIEFMKSLKPVVWFRMEGKETDRVLHDEVGGRDAKLSWDGPGNPFVKGAIGKGLWLRGAKFKDFAELAKYPQAARDKLSVAAWVYAESLPPLAAVVSDWTTAGQFHFGISPSGEQSLCIHVMGRDGQLARLTEAPDHAFPLYEWQHIAFATDGAVVRLYRQGREVGSMKHNGLLYPAPNDTLGIGSKPPDRNDSADQGTGSNHWDGKLDEIAVFHHALTAEDIRKLAAAPPR